MCPSAGLENFFEREFFVYYKVRRFGGKIFEKLWLVLLYKKLLCDNSIVTNRYKNYTNPLKRNFLLDN